MARAADRLDRFKAALVAEGVAVPDHVEHRQDPGGARSANHPLLRAGVRRPQRRRVAGGAGGAVLRARRPAPRWLARVSAVVARTAEAQLEGAETRAVIAAAIELLPATQRLVISLRDVEGWPAAEVCNVLEISETNQRVLLHRARSRVRAALERYLAEAGS